MIEISLKILNIIITILIIVMLIPAVDWILSGDLLWGRYLIRKNIDINGLFGIILTLSLFILLPILIACLILLNINLIELICLNIFNIINEQIKFVP